MVHVLKRRVAYVAEGAVGLVNAFPPTSVVPTRHGAGRVVWQISVNAAMANQYSRLQASTSCAAMVCVQSGRTARVRASLRGGRSQSSIHIHGVQILAKNCH
jgi:hypothetical protein